MIDWSILSAFGEQLYFWFVMELEDYWFLLFDIVQAFFLSINIWLFFGFFLFVIIFLGFLFVYTLSFYSFLQCMSFGQWFCVINSYAIRGLMFSFASIFCLLSTDNFCLWLVMRLENYSNDWLPKINVIIFFCVSFVYFIDFYGFLLCMWFGQWFCAIKMPRH